MRREPFKETLIRDLHLGDHNVAISGYILKRGDGLFFLDDGTGEILVHAEKVPEVDVVKVLGGVLAYDNGFELQAEIIQDYSSVDKELLKKVKELLQNQKFK